MQICAKCGFENKDKAKKCENCLTDLHWAKVNLGKFNGSPSDTIRIGEEAKKERGFPKEELVEEERLNIGQAVGLGALVGWFTLLIILIILRYPSPPVFYTWISSFLGTPFGIAGAMAGRRLGKDWLSVFVGSLIATILGLGCLFFGLFYFGFLAQ